MKTWQMEGAVVALLLASTAILTGNRWQEWVGALAVQLTFHHAAISDRMAERQARMAKPDVTCFRWSVRLFLAKESVWLVYFAVSHTYSALVGVFLFLLYPFWRKMYRQYHPLRDTP
jgi:hypothetical protein